MSGLFQDPNSQDPSPPAASSQDPSAQDPGFETALVELEAIVARMEGSQMALEESLQSYRRGTELIRYCQAQLAEAQQQVRVLEGDLLKPFADAGPGPGGQGGVPNGK